MNIDTEALRNDLIDYYGTAMFAASPMAMMEVAVVCIDCQNLCDVRRKPYGNDGGFC